MTSASAGLKITRISQSAVLAAPRFSYSPAIVAGPFVFVSGMVGLVPETGRLASSGAYDETRQLLENLRALCSEQGWSLNNIIMARVFCTGDNVSGEVNRAWSEFFKSLPLPARTFAVVNSLPLNASVEIEFELLN